MVNEFIPDAETLALKRLGCENIMLNVKGFTYWEAFKFFRKKFNLNFYIDNYYSERFYPKIQCMLHPTTRNTRKLQPEIWETKTYEEAELMGLRKLIEIANEERNNSI